MRRQITHAFKLGMAYKDLGLASAALLVTAFKKESPYWNGILDRAIDRAEKRLNILFREGTGNGRRK